MSTMPVVEKAQLRICHQDPCQGGESFPVHFNPQSLQYSITSNLPNAGSGNKTKQYAGQSTGQLVMDLIFDTTHSGEDVRLSTLRVARLMEPSGSEQTPPRVEFGWGVYSFVGLVKGYRETLDFFSADGVPLRATVNLTLSSQENLFERRLPGGPPEPDPAKAAAREAAEVPPPPPGSGRGLTDIATRLGRPEQTRALAEQNQIENPRFPPPDRPIVIEPESAPPPAAPQAGRGRFAGLRAAQPPRPAAKPDLDRLRPGATSQGLDAQDPSAFNAGGLASPGNSGGLKADVGRPGQLRQRLQFKEDDS